MKLTSFLYFSSPCDSNPQSFGSSAAAQPVVSHPDQSVLIQSIATLPAAETVIVQSDSAAVQSDVVEQHNAVKQTKSNSCAPNSRQSSSDSFNQVPSSHENSVSPPRQTSSRKKIANIFRNKSGSSGNLGQPSSPEDCSTDSGSVNEEVIRHKKKRMFLHLRKSKPKLT